MNDINNEHAHRPIMDRLHQHRTVIGGHQHTKSSQIQEGSKQSYQDLLKLEQSPQIYPMKDQYKKYSQDEIPVAMNEIKSPANKNYYSNNHHNIIQKLPPLEIQNNTQQQQQQEKAQENQRQKNKRGTDILIRESRGFEKNIYKQQLTKIIQGQPQLPPRNIKQNGQQSRNQQKTSSLPPQNNQQVPLNLNKKESFEELEQDFERNKKNLEQKNSSNNQIPKNNSSSRFVYQYKQVVKSHQNIPQNLKFGKNNQMSNVNIINSTKLSSQKQPNLDLQHLFLSDDLYSGIYKDKYGTQKQFFINSLVKSRAGQYSATERKTNQDSSINLIKRIADQQVCFFGVLDGHGEFGEIVSNFVKEKLQKYLFAKINSLNSIPQILTETFENTSNDLLGSNHINTYLSGTTAVSVFIQGNKIYCANCGDSRAIMARNNHNQWKSISLSNDHKPDLPSEKKRIQQSGGRVELQVDENGQDEGIYRVWNKNLTYPGLAMARSLGDKAGREVGVISEPEILCFEIGEDDKFIVIASDGVWEFLSNDQVINIVAPYYKNNNINGAADSLIKQSVKLWQENDDTVDDITCVILFIRNQEEQKNLALKK